MSGETFDPWDEPPGGVQCQVGLGIGAFLFVLGGALLVAQLSNIELWSSRGTVDALASFVASCCGLLIIYGERRHLIEGGEW